jgi:hypothetical protein
MPCQPPGLLANGAGPGGALKDGHPVTTTRVSAAFTWPNRRPVGLPEGTRVRNRDTGQYGTVMPYEAEHTQGWFPVRRDDQIYERCYAFDVTGVTPEMSAQRRSPAAKAS